MKFELTKDDLKIIEQLLDLALKSGGLSNKLAVDRLLNVFANPIKEEDVKNT